MITKRLSPASRMVLPLLAALALCCVFVFCACAQAAAYASQTPAPKLPPGETRIGSYYITISAPADATVYYTTDGSTPVVGSTSFIPPGSVRELYVQKQVHLAAIAVAPGSLPSEVARASYFVQVAAPVLPANKTAVEKQVVTISAPSKASLYYTLDGSYPSTSSARLAAGQSASLTFTKTTTVHAIAVLSGCVESKLTSATYRVKTATPTSSQIPASRSATGSYELKLTVPKGKVFYYTTDGNTPTTSSKAINTIAETASAAKEFFVTLKATRTFKFIAVQSGMDASDVYSATYTIQSEKPAALKGESGIGSVSVRLAPTGGAAWHYTTNGSTPTTKSAKVAAGSAKTLTLKKNTVLKVVAVSAGCAPSAVVQSTFKVKTANPKLPANSTKTGTYTIKLAPPSGTTWYYTTNGKKPSVASSSAVLGGYPKNLSVSKNIKLQVIAVQNGCEASAVVSATYRVRTPAPKLPAGKTAVNSYTVKLTVPANTTWYITTDGKVPTSRMTPRRAGSIVNVQITSNVVIRVLAIRNGCDASAVSSRAYYVQAPNAKASLKAGTYKGTQTLKLSANATGAKVYYTTNGSTPTTKSKLYSGPIKITKTTTVKALVVRPGCKNSNIVTLKYTIQK